MRTEVFFFDRDWLADFDYNVTEKGSPGGSFSFEPPTPMQYEVVLATLQILSFETGDYEPCEPIPPWFARAFGLWASTNAEIADWITEEFANS